MEEEQKPITPHVLMFPFPAQGHINATLKLAELFSLQRFHVTFINTQHNHRRLSTDVHSRFGQWPGFTFREISDGLPDDHPRSGNFLVELHYSINTTTKKLLRDMLISMRSESGDPVTCIIADGANLFIVDVAEELRIPLMLFHTTSACYCWASFSTPELVEAGELPMREGGDMDRVLNGIPGMEGLLRLRDLPSYLRSIDIIPPEFQSYLKESLNAKRTLGIIFNTFEDMEAPVLAQIRTHCPNIYTIGPVHVLVKSRNPDYSPLHSRSSLWKEDNKCIPWLDKQPKKSVIYVSFGSLVVITRDEFLEILYGLVKSSQRFLWVLRSDLLGGKDEGVPEELVEVIKERGLMVDWAPQEEVLANASVAGFLTHSGWNSTLESVFAGVPMICWPNNFDQQVNSRFVGHVWKVGLDMKDNCNREVLEKFIRELMAGKREEFEEAAGKMAKLASRCVREGGSSYSNLENLMRDVRSIGLSGPFRLKEILSI